MNRNYHLQFINNPVYYNTIIAALAENIEEVIINKSQSNCDDFINWDYELENAQALLSKALSNKNTVY